MRTLTRSSSSFLRLAVMMTNLLRCTRNREPLLMLIFAGLTSGKAGFVLLKVLPWMNSKDSFVGKFAIIDRNK